MINKDLLAELTNYGTLDIFNITSGSKVHTLSGHLMYTWFNSLILLNEKYFASYVGPEVIFWRIADLKNETKIANATNIFLKGIKLLKNRLNMITAAVNGEIRIWDTDSFRILATFLSCNGVNSLEVLEDDLIAIGCSSGEVRIHDPDTFRVKMILKNKEAKLVVLEYLKNGHIACGLEGGFINVWDTVKKVQIKQLFYNMSVQSLKLIGDGLLASGYSNGFIKIWNISNETEIMSFRAHQYHVLVLTLISGNKLRIHNNKELI